MRSFPDAIGRRWRNSRPLGSIGEFFGLCRGNGKENGNYHLGFRDIGISIGVILGLCWCYIGIMEKKMETTLLYII